ncbi:MAG: NADH:flavin oxidoreductase [Desulfosalsimonas sp.]
MSILFEPSVINGMVVANRFVRSATYDGCADRNGHVTDPQLKIFDRLAAGGTGLIVTGITYVHESGRISAFQNSAAGDDCIPGLRRLADTVHERGAKIAVQLFHAGREAAGFLKTKNMEAAGPSVVENDPYFSRPYRSLTDREIEEIISAFADAAQRVRAAGFDAVQLHAAHSYLPAQFLSPFTNQRRDRWGGSLENRLRLHREIYSAMREKVGAGFPLLVKLGVCDGFEGGLEFGQGLQAARSLARIGFDALEISSGIRGRRYRGTEFKTGINRPEHEAYFRDWCRRVKDEVDVPVMMVGGLRSFPLMEKILENNEADFISLCRPLIREPGIVGSWKAGDMKKPSCISCNKCLEALHKGQMLQCVRRLAEE